jgi:hypothetical protein
LPTINQAVDEMEPTSGQLQRVIVSARRLRNSLALRAGIDVQSLAVGLTVFEGEIVDVSARLVTAR